MEIKKVLIAIIILLLVIIISAIGIFLNRKYGDSEVVMLNTEVTEGETIEEKKVEIYNGEDRPIAVMIDNHKDALPQGGVNQAYMIYEIIVEGGASRIMALFKGGDVEKIGSVRSARHYFIDYALENDAIFTHYGWSPQAESDIKSLNVQNINGMVESTSDFWRVKDKSSPHNVATSLAKLKEIAEEKKYRLTSTDTSVLKYVTNAVNLTEGSIANKVVIPYSDSNVVKYEYNEETGRYQRYSQGVEEKEWTTKEPVTTKNIIITFAQNRTINDGENKDRQTLDNVKTLNGYYITNGKAIKITCEKTSRTAKTVYKDLNGKVIEVNDGNTWVQICPIDSNVEME